MSDETEDVVEEVENVDTETVAKPQDKKANKVTFTEEQQAHINSLLAAERKSAEKRYKVQADGATSALETVKADVAFYEEQMAKIIETQIADFEPVAQELFKALPIREQLEKLSDEKFVAKVRSKTKVPVTPKSESKKSQFTRRQTI